MFFKKYKKMRNCVHRYNVVDAYYGGITEIERYVLLCNKCEKRLSVMIHEYNIMLKKGLIESREEYDARVSNHVKTKK